MGQIDINYVTDSVKQARSRSPIKRTIPVFVILLLLIAVVPGHAQDSALSSDKSTYIVVFNDAPGVSAEATSATLESYVESYGGEVKYDYSIIDGMAVTLSDSEASRLSALPNVKYVEKDQQAQLLLDGAVRQIGADNVWLQGYDGEGVKIGVIDTGIDVNHPDLNNGKVVAWADFVYGINSTSFDGNGHGTHCAGIIAGTGNASGGKYKGVAPKASLMSAQIFNYSTMSANYSDMIRAIDWADANGAQVISLSVGGDVHSQSLEDAVANAVSQGIVVVVAAGNNGPDGYTPHKILCPGDAESVITVGAVDRTDLIAGFSSRGPTSDGRVKPDVSNVGVSVMSAKANGNPSNGYYVQKSGTSMATPMTAGVVALMLQKNPSLTPDQVKYILERTAKPLGSAQPNNDYGWGRVWANRSVNNSSYCGVSFNVSSYYVNEDAGTVTINVTKFGNDLFPASVNFATSDGTAHEGTNYVTESGTLTFQPADMFRTFTVSIKDDNVLDAQKYFTVSLSSPVNATLASDMSSRVYINDTDVLADFKSNIILGASPLTVQFNDTSIGMITSWQWNFGDGTGNSSERNATHTFINAGPDVATFTVTLTASNATGSSTKEILNYITVNPQPPVANFESNVTAGSVPLTIQFTDTSTGTANDWQWDFGDGTANSSLQNPVHVYNAKGVYNVTLTIQNDGGSSTVTRIKRINVTGYEPITFNVSLCQGWNMISIPVLPEDTNFTHLIPADARDHIYVIWSYEGGGVWKYWTELPGYTSTLTDVDVQHGYQICCDAPISFNVTGTLPESDQVSVVGGDWNIIGYPKLEPTDPAERYSDALVVWSLRNGSWYYYTSLPGYTNTLISMEPGYGYEVYK